MGVIASLADSSIRTRVGASAPVSFPVDQTYDTPLSATSKVVLDSRELGWKNLFANLTAGRAWSGWIAPIEHPAIVYCLRGVNRVERRIEGEAQSELVTFRPRRLAFMPTHAPAHYDVRGGADVLVVHLRGEMVRDIAGRAFGLRAERIHFRPRMAFLDPLLEQLCLGILGAMQRRDPAGDTPYVDHLAETIAAHCLRHYVSPDAPASVPLSLSACVGGVCDYIERHLEDDLGLERLAAHARLTPSTLTQAFRAQLGVTPHQWILARRVERAARLIADTDLPLAEIALEAGFSSQSHLTTTFKRHMRETPQGYRMGR